jgi:hypothetical protein
MNRDDIPVNVSLEPGLNCDDSLNFTLEARIEVKNTSVVFELPGRSRCGKLFGCDSASIEQIDCAVDRDKVVNPYFTNILGTWHKHKSYKWQTDRHPQTVSVNSDLRYDGYYQQFTPFWNFNGNQWQPQPQDWVRANKVTLQNPDNRSLENKDPLDRYKAARWGYNFQRPQVTAANAHYREVYFDGFEDYYGLQALQHASVQCDSFAFADYREHITPESAHTGLYSMAIPSDEKIVFEAPAKLPPYEDKYKRSVPYELGPGDCRGVFAPCGNETGGWKRYVISYWIRLSNTVIGTPHQLTALTVKLNDQVIPVQEQYVSPLIEGWQQVEYTFWLPEGAPGIFRVEWERKSPFSSVDFYLDDVRLHPFEANMKAYVFQPYSHRLGAELDKNNFATFYQYDAEGQLQERIKETENGLMYMEYNKRARKVR